MCTNGPQRVKRTKHYVNDVQHLIKYNTHVMDPELLSCIMV